MEKYTLSDNFIGKAVCQLITSDKTKIKGLVVTGNSLGYNFEIR
jgi:hypothetical protein